MRTQSVSKTYLIPKLLKTIDVAQTGDVIRGISVKIQSSLQYLTQLDSLVGDGDHGSNLDRGFSEAVQKLSSFKTNDVGAMLELVGSTLLSSIGGASGPIYGTAFRKAGRVVRGKENIGARDVAQMIQAAEQGIATIGGAKLGDKTILDSIHPASEAALEASTRGEEDLVRLFEVMTAAAESGLEATKYLTAKKGRAMYLGDRSVGIYDVGAASFCLMIRSALESIKQIDARTSTK
jgi:phosphoenolpyruvate---glycerone phosphotransferase subunit DhaL